MLLSVVVPCFNHERYVEECLRSIDAQDVDLEVLLVDDGSTDETWDRISCFDWTPGRHVRALRTPNRGAHAALNTGLSLASGHYVALCNSDDRYGPGRLKTLVNALVREQARFAFSGVRFVDAQGEDISAAWPYAKELVARQAAITRFASVGFALVPSNVTISTGNFVFERSLLDEVGYFRPYRYVHDWDFVLRTLLVTEPLYVPQPLYDYRLHPQNSFLALEQDAARECPELMRRFLKAAHAREPKNRLCPSPSRWPFYFESFLEEHRYQPYLAAWDQVDDPFFGWTEPLPASAVEHRVEHARLEVG